ncbi:MAG: helix-turn-helix domain-containing protein [Chromatiales bacterium]|nr:helix-turn-helix domain-containing protein [Chromatiales bacterium]
MPSDDTTKSFSEKDPLTLLPPDEVAEILGVSTGTLMVWRSTGRYNLPFVKVGGRVRYRRADVEHFINSRTMEHTNAPA